MTFIQEEQQRKKQCDTFDMRYRGRPTDSLEGLYVDTNTPRIVHDFDSKIRFINKCQQGLLLSLSDNFSIEAMDALDKSKEFDAVWGLKRNDVFKHQAKSIYTANLFTSIRNGISWVWNKIVEFCNWIINFITGGNKNLNDAAANSKRILLSDLSPMPDGVIVKFWSKQELDKLVSGIRSVSAEYNLWLMKFSSFIKSNFTNGHTSTYLREDSKSVAVYEFDESRLDKDFDTIFSNMRLKGNDMFSVFINQDNTIVASVKPVYEVDLKQVGFTSGKLIIAVGDQLDQIQKELNKMIEFTKNITNHLGGISAELSSAKATGAPIEALTVLNNYAKEVFVRYNLCVTNTATLASAVCQLTDAFCNSETGLYNTAIGAAAYIAAEKKREYDASHPINH